MASEEKRMQTVFGWLFGLKGESGNRISEGSFTIRAATRDEVQRVMRASGDFFASNLTIWSNCLNQFPFVFEKRAPDQCPIGADDSVAVLISLLAPGEVRSPVVWSLHESNRSAAGASGSQVIDCFYRLINGRFQTVELQVIAEQAKIAFSKLENFLSSSPYDHLDAVLLDRLYESKEHILAENAPPQHIINRAADICMGLESLYGEGGGEIQFKLAISIAWLLEKEAARREQVMTYIKETYRLRSKTVHGGKSSNKPLLKTELDSVLTADHLFRRSVLTRLVNGLTEENWKDTFRRRRVGLNLTLDTVDWG
jgi:Apea-like HEPN